MVGDFSSFLGEIRTRQCGVPVKDRWEQFFAGGISIYMDDCVGSPQDCVDIAKDCVGSPKDYVGSPNDCVKMAKDWVCVLK